MPIQLQMQGQYGFLVFSGDYVMINGQAQTGAFARLFGGEEGIKNP